MNGERYESKGTIWMIGQVKWDFFVTIPLPHRVGIAAEKALRIWGGFRGDLCSRLEIDSWRLLWAAALEFGPSGKNPHLHALISGPLRGIDPQLFTQICEEIGKRMNLPRIVASRYDSRRDAASYICKEANRSSARGTSDGRWPMISDSTQRALRRHPDRR